MIRAKRIRLPAAAALALLAALVAGAPRAEETPPAAAVAPRIAPEAQGRDPEPAVRIDRADLSLRASAWSRSRLLDGDMGVNSASAWFLGKAALGEGGKAVIDAWARSDSRFDSRAGASDVREAYVAGSRGDWDFSAGRQLIAWGRADSVNPTDVLPARNFTLLTPLDEDQKTGVGSVRATWNRDALRLSALWLPEFRSSTLPLPAVPGVSFVARDPSAAARQWALRAEKSGERVDWAVSYFDGYERQPDLRPEAFSAAGARVGLAHTRIQMLGADAATTVGRYGLRAEVALTRTEDRHGTDPFTRNPFLYAVVGGDRTFLTDLNVNAQLLYRRVVAWEDPAAVPAPLRELALRQALLSNQRDAEQAGATVRVARKWWNDTLEAELSGVAWFARGDFLVRPRLRYAATDRLRFTLGGDVYRGPADSFFGSLRNLSTAFVEVQFNL
ncbi:MAG: hypothetical protein ING70_09450 [Rhodocyclaceae bacterium]|nr:hypothetical protein [Rhodocyclaceae bacterium]MCA3136231.1 hypothetical protein [Rhodocyclaceae bacterium]MCA3145873.1 hypothetical protein [Rhodocyclaceae bacterium]